MANNFRSGLLGTTSLTPAEALGFKQEAPALNTDPKPNVSPEEQSRYDETIENAYSLVYDEKSLAAILPTLTSVEGLANAVASVFSRLNDSANRSGRPVPPEVLFQGGAEVLEDLAVTAEKFGVKTFSEDEINKAMLVAMEVFRTLQEKSGSLDANAAAADFSDLMDADERGELEQMLPGVSAAYPDDGAPLGGPEAAPQNAGAGPGPQGGPVPQGGPGPLPPQGAAALVPEEVA